MSMDTHDRDGRTAGVDDGTEDRAMARFAAAVGARLRTPVAPEVRDRQADAAAAVAAEGPTAGAAGAAGVAGRRLRRTLAWGGPLALAAGLLGVVVVGPVLRGDDDALPLIAVGPAAGAGAAMSAEAGPAADGGAGRAVGDLTRPADLPSDLSLWRPVTYVFTLDEDVRADADGGTAWAFEAPSDLAAAAVRVATLLDLPTPGPSEWGDGSLTAAAPDGASLTVVPSGEWFFSAASDAWPEWTCTEGGECAAPPPAVGLPTDAAARTAATDLLRSAGAPAVRVSDVYRDDWSVSVALEVPLPDGPAGLGAGAWVTFGAAGELLSASGTLARPVVLGRYPTVDVAAAVARLEDDLAGPITATPLPADAAGAGAVETGVVEPGVVEPGMPGDPAEDLEPEVVEVRIVDAELAPSWAWTPEGRMLVVPHYRLRDADGGEWWVVAVDDRYLAPNG